MGMTSLLKKRPGSELHDRDSLREATVRPLRPRPSRHSRPELGSFGREGVTLAPRSHTHIAT